MRDLSASIVCEGAEENHQEPSPWTRVVVTGSQHLEGIKASGSDEGTCVGVLSTNRMELLPDIPQTFIVGSVL